ncbi:MAG: chemotaxis protein CheW [Magnetococcales bacterium]|nr:chemotaxis protein CheW [Magnetococcales bacterium]
MSGPDLQQAMLAEFFSETRDALDRIEADLLRLEGEPGNRELVHTIFRHMHTAKGNCRMMGFGALEGLTHGAENLLEHLREGRVAAEQGICSLLLRVIDLTRQGIDHVEAHGAESGVDYSVIKLDLAMLHPEASRDQAGAGAEAAGGNGPPAGGEGGAVLEHNQMIRLSTRKLDALMNQVGELGASFNHLRFAVRHHPEEMDQSLEMMEQRLHALQDQVLQYRLQPVGGVWDTFHRLVRDLAVATGKKVLLETSGDDTEVDRNVLFSIKDSLGHLVRNAVDHGLESGPERERTGKSPIGRVRLHAEQRHGQIYIEVSDDGRGIDPDAVARKAIERELVTPAQAGEMDHEALFRLLLLPGFSTAAQVTEISGRGTGLDVVKTAVEKVGGMVHILSEPGQGATFRLRIPQTMSIVPSLMVRAAGGTYGIPQSHVVELVSFHGPEVTANLAPKLHSVMVRIRGELFSLVLLDRVMAGGDASLPAADLRRILDAPAIHVALLQSDSGTFGLAVDAILEPANLVIKPLHRALNHLTFMTGTAVMPDGSVAFLLNVHELF